MEVYTVCQFTHCSDDSEPTGWSKVYASMEAAKAGVQEYMDGIAEDEQWEDRETPTWHNESDRATATIFGDTCVVITKATLV